MARKLTETCETFYTINLYKGQAWNKEFTYTDANGEPIDLSTTPVSIKFKDVFPDQLELFSDGSPTALNSSLEITDAVGGKFTVKLSKDEILTAEVGTGSWWIEFYDTLDVDKQFGHPMTPNDVIVREI